MIKIIKYDGTKTFMYPNGSIATPQKMQNDFPAVLVFPHVIETDEGEQVCYAVQNLSAIRSMYNIDTSLTDDEAIIEIQLKRNESSEISNVASPEERIASALEFQNLLAI